MKKSLFALAALGLVAGAAQAQSSVTLYGVADMNIEFASHMSSVSGTNGPSGNVTRMSSGGLSGSRWGLRGVEDLGSGMKALFVLENGFALDTGSIQQGGRLFGRQAYVGLENSQFGRITLGRQYTTLFDLLANFSPSGYATQYEPVVAQLGVNFRSDNTVKYTGVFGPVTAIAHWSFGAGAPGNGEVPGQFRRDTAYGAGVGYAAGPFGATIAYDQFNPTESAAAGTTTTYKKAAVAGSYAFGPAKVMAGYRWGQAKSSAGASVLRDDYYWIGANYQVTAPLGLTLQYNYDNVKSFNGVNVPNPWQVSFIADYNLSKRTDVYLTAAYAKNAGLNLDTAAIGFANGYALGAGKTNMLGAGVGIRHKF
ncbi:porin [Cupriavidus basilensis]|uniref:Porin n=1 Tax=Cupriavidus basilensis TaxID=68895 RepID=A0ABT6AHZ6_9BURK|nr:porin [Cupriavidus basilensis]MDF3832225.1 porin [Cupriavidus basilensis]